MLTYSNKFSTNFHQHLMVHVRRC